MPLAFAPMPTNASSANSHKGEIIIHQQCTDERYPDAVQCVRANPARICIGLIQRNLAIGYNRAERLMLALIAEGVVEEFAGTHGSVYKIK